MEPRESLGWAHRVRRRRVAARSSLSSRMKYAVRSRRQRGCGRGPGGRGGAYVFVETDKEKGSMIIDHLEDGSRSKRYAFLSGTRTFVHDGKHLCGARVRNPSNETPRTGISEELQAPPVVTPETESGPDVNDENEEAAQTVRKELFVATSAQKRTLADSSNTQPHPKSARKGTRSRAVGLLSESPFLEKSECPLI